MRFCVLADDRLDTPSWVVAAVGETGPVGLIAI